MYRVSIEFWYKSTSVLSRMPFADWLRYSLPILWYKKQKEERKTRFFLENDSEKILEQAQSAVERDFTKHKIGMVLNQFQG